MNIKKIFAAASLSLLLAGCGNDGPGNGNGPVDFSNQFLTIDLKLPTTTGTRAGNDNFDDGTANEYRVNNSCLVLFLGADESSATFLGAYDMTSLTSAETPEGNQGNVTASYRVTMQLNNLNPIDDADNLYGFVMANYKNVATVTDNNGLTVNVADINGGTSVKMATAESTFASLFAQLTKAGFYNGEGIDANNFFMCNAPLINQPGGATNPSEGKVSLLTKLDKNCISMTPSDAEKVSAATFFLERGVAKAQLNWNATEFIEDEDGAAVKAADGSRLQFAFVGWDLDVEENVSYIARNVDGADWYGYKNERVNNYRFVGSKAMSNVDNLFRIYWCYDPHYTATDPEIPASQFKTAFSFKESGTPLYCYENTFDVKRMDYANTTRAVFEVHLGFGENKTPKTFWVVDGNEKSIFIDEKSAESKPRKFIVESNLIADILKKSLKVETGGITSLNTSEIEQMVNISFSTEKESGLRKVVEIAFADIQKLAVGTEAQQALASKFVTQPAFAESDMVEKQGLIADANTFKIEEYTDGKMYYEVRFMHFGGNGSDSDLAPLDWDPKDTANQVPVLDIDKAYGFAANPAKSRNNYLGRYGMVRNNWYVINVTGVKHLGSPVIPSANISVSDDNREVEKYLTFKINILSWAKRVQSWDF